MAQCAPLIAPYGALVGTRSLSSAGPPGPASGRPDGRLRPDPLALPTLRLDFFDQPPRMAGDPEVLVGRHPPHRHRSASPRYARTAPRICLLVASYSQPTGGP